MATHSSTLAWKIPGTEEPGGLQSMGLLGVGHDWATSLSLFTFHFHALEKEMATHSSVLAWRIPETGEPVGLLSLGSHRVRHDWSDLAAAEAAFIGKTDAEAETPILWPPHVKNWLIGKDPDAGKDWRQEEKRTTENNMVGWHHWLDGHEFEQAPRVGDGQGSLACCSPWGSQRVRHNWATELNWTMIFLFSVHRGLKIT